MLVRDCMQRRVVSVGPDDTLAEALRLTREHRIRHLPVVLANGDVAGILSDRDIRLAMPSPLTTEEAERVEVLAGTPIGAVMVRDVITIGPDEAIEDAAKLLYRYRIGALPVLDGSARLVGMLTETDVLHAFVVVLGVSEPSTRMELELLDRPGELGRALSVIGDRAGVNIVSVLVTSRPEGGKRRAVLHLATIDPRETIRELSAAGFKVGWPTFETHSPSSQSMPLPG